MNRSLARAGLLLSLALVRFAVGEEPSRPQEAAPRHLALRKELLHGNLEPLQTMLARLKSDMKSRGKFSLSLEDAIDLQNLEAQIPNDGSTRIIELFEVPEGDLAYLRARAEPSRKAFEGVLAAHPGHRLSQRAIAVMDADDGKWADARTAFERLVAENGRDAETRHRYAFAAYYQGEVDLALDQWSAALAADPGCSEAWYGVGVVWLGRGLFESAQKALTKALEFDLINWRAREAIIQALVGQNKMAEAKRERDVLRDRAAQFTRVGDQIKVAVLPRDGGASITREGLLDSVPWRFRIELFDQARTGGKPIKIMELRRDGEAFAWGEVSAGGEFRPFKSLPTLPELEQVLEEAK